MGRRENAITAKEEKENVWRLQPCVLFLLPHPFPSTFTIIPNINLWNQHVIVNVMVKVEEERRSHEKSLPAVDG